MTLFQLECFAALADSLNFTQTATAMYITQPALSRAISSLEQELQLTLLMRTTHSVTLTPAGKAFAEECDALIEGMHRGIERAKSAQNGLIGNLRIGFQRDAFEPFAVDFLNAFRREHPDISLELLPFSPSQLLHVLGLGEADAVIAGGCPPTDTTRQALLASRQEYAVLPLGHPLASRSSISMKELSRESFIVMSRSASYSGYESVISKALDAGFEAKIVAQVEYVPSLMMLVACGKGVSILHNGFAPLSQGRLVFVPLQQVPSFNRWLMWESTNENPCLEALTRHAQEWEKQLAASGRAFSGAEPPAEQDGRP